MTADRRKAELIGELHNAQKETYVQCVLNLVDILINEARIDNDTTTPDGVLKNQGEIRGFVRLKEYIERGLPGQKA